jgi:hypothetical protein
MTRDTAAQVCTSMGMRLARTDDNEESEGVLAARANDEFPKEKAGDIWIDGQSNGSCSYLHYMVVSTVLLINTYCRSLKFYI